MLRRFPGTRKNALTGPEHEETFSMMLKLSRHKSMPRFPIQADRANATWAASSLNLHASKYQELHFIETL